jgi:glycosyltransferase involved in cell wall biosynthesis
MPRPVASITVVIATRNRAPQLARSLEALRRQRPPEGVTVDAIVVDNGSTDDTPKVVAAAARDFPFPLRAVREEQAGRSRALNLGLVEAAGDLIFLLDDDARPFDGWLVATWEAFAQRDADVVGGRLIPPPDFRRPDWFDDSMLGMLALLDWGDEPIVLTRRFPYGANLSFRRDTALRLGGYDLRLGRTGTSLLAAEDHEFCRRVHRSRGLVLYWPASRCEHDVVTSRLSRDYMRQWKFHAGRSNYYMHVQSELPRIGRVPRTLLRRAGEEMLQWLAAVLRFDGRDAFRHELHLHELRGTFYEALRGHRLTGDHPVLMPRPDEPVTVVIPARNAAGSIVATIRSVLDGDKAPDEILVVDDGSEDGTAAAAAALSPLVRVLPSRAAGARAARNTGIEAARGEWVAFLNAGERWTPGRLRAQFEMLKHYPEVALVSSHAAFEDAGGAPRATGGRHPYPNTPGFHVEQLLRDDYVATGTVLARRAVLLACGGFREELPHGADFDLWVRIAARYPTLFVDHVGSVAPRSLDAAGVEHGFLGREEIAARHLAETELPPARQRSILRDLGARIARERGALRWRSGDRAGARADALRLMRLRPLDPRWLGLLLLALLAPGGGKRPQ